MSRVYVTFKRKIGQGLAPKRQETATLLADTLQDSIHQASCDYLFVLKITSIPKLFVDKVKLNRSRFGANIFLDMKVILCYGDSNTWGYDPHTQERFSSRVRWTGVLARQLGEEYHMIEEGLSGRTTVWDDPVEGLHKNGKNYLLPCLESHQPIDLVILMLGTNDLKMRFSVPAADIGRGIVGVQERAGFGTPRCCS
jgi:lysophospholipase L1-like esterase